MRLPQIGEQINECKKIVYIVVESSTRRVESIVDIVVVVIDGNAKTSILYLIVYYSVPNSSFKAEVLASTV